jgi:peptide chain release factor subunit 1
VLGLQEVIDAANVQAIETLVVAGAFERPGVICDSCGHLMRSGDSCPVCGEATFPVDDIVGAVMEAVVAAGGTVSQISVASPLDRSGVGATTRFPVSARV